MKLSLQILPHHKCVATLPRKMSDDALKPTTPLTGSVINVDQVGQSRSVWLIAPLVSGVAGLDASSSSRRTHWKFDV